MRALITTIVVFPVVISAPFLWLSGAFTLASPLLGTAVFLFWLVVMCPFLGALFVVWIEDERPQFLPSDIFSSKRDYLSWNSINGWPRDPHLFYECGICHKSLPSHPDEPVTCGCGNLFLGPDHIGAQNPAQVRLFQN